MSTYQVCRYSTNQLKLENMFMLADRFHNLRKKGFFSFILVKLFV